MYSKAEAFHIKKEFWTTFGMYMKPIKNAEGSIINWINYKTGIRHFYFRMDANRKNASIAIEMKHPSTDNRLLLYKQLEIWRDHFKAVMQEPWSWQQIFYDDDGSEASRVVKTLENVSVFNKDHWPLMITFLKERIIKLDAFWHDVKIHFEV